MRSRSIFHFAPAQGNVLYTPQQTEPQGPPDIVNYDRLLILIFFVGVPFLWLISWIFHGFLWLVFVAILGALTLLWLKRGFTARGRLTMTAIYAIFAILSLSGALSGSAAPPRTSNAPLTPIQASQSFTTPLPSAQPAGTEPDAANDASANGQLSECEKVLVRFLDCWKAVSYADMVPLTAESWRAKARTINGPEQKLSSQFYGKKLDSFTFEGEPTETETSTSRTVTVLADVIIKKEHRQLRFYAIMLKEDGQWLVDPNSMVTGTPVDSSTPAPNVDSGEEKATATPKATPAPSKKLKLYFNEKGGQLYHTSPNCEKVAKKYRPLKSSFTYGNIGKSPQKNLEPCPVCNAPARP